MKKRAAAIISSLLVLGCAYPVFAAPKNVYTDADSGFAVQTMNPMIEYASKSSYGFQENNSTTDSYHSVAAIPAVSFCCGHSRRRSRQKDRNRFHNETV